MSDAALVSPSRFAGVLRARPGLRMRALAVPAPHRSRGTRHWARKRERRGGRSLLVAPTVFPVLTCGTISFMAERGLNVLFTKGWLVSRPGSLVELWPRSSEVRP